MAQEKLELHTLSDHDLEARIAEDQVRLKKLKFGHAVSPMENPLNIRMLRREIARLKTEQRKRELNPVSEEDTDTAGTNE